MNYKKQQILIRYLTIFARNTDSTAGIDTAFDCFSNFSFTLNICGLQEDQDLDNVFIPLES